MSTLVQSAEKRDARAQWQHAYLQYKPPFLSDQKNEAFRVFLEIGFPDTGNEEWKYSSVLPLLKKEIAPVLEPSPYSMLNRDIRAMLPENLECNLLVFVNGFYASSLSSIPEKDKGIVISNIAQNHNSLSLPQNEVNNKLNGFVAQNMAFFGDGAFVKVTEDCVMELPLVILWLQDTLSGDRTWFARNQYEICKGASAQIIHLYGHLGEGMGMENIVNDIQLHENAHLDFSQLQLDQSPSWLIEHSFIEVGKDSEVNALNLSGGHSFSRNDLQIKLKGINASGRMFGLFAGGKNEHIDNHTLVEHCAPNGYSEELYKGILAGTSKGVFNGKIYVHEGATKTNAFQSNRNLLLAEGALIQTKPQLEIYNDDVKCSHGATIGRLDTEALFYLRTRGLNEIQSKRLLTEAFAGEIIQKIPVESLRNRATNWIGGLFAW